MKKVFIFLAALSALASWAGADPRIESFTGSYQAVDASCGYDTAFISFEDRSQKALAIDLKGSESATHRFELENLNRSIRRNMTVENIKVRHSLKKKILISETRGCVSGWLFCGPWRLNMEVEQLDAKTIKVSSHHHQPCVFKKQESMVISDSESALLKRVK